MSPVTMPLWKAIGTETSLFSAANTFYRHLRRESEQEGGLWVTETLNSWEEAVAQSIHKQCNGFAVFVSTLLQSSACKMILDEDSWWHHHHANNNNNNFIFNKAFMEGTSVNSELPRRRRAASRMPYQEGTALTLMPPRHRNNKRHQNDGTRMDIADTLIYEQPRIRGGGGGRHVVWSESERLEI